MPDTLATIRAAIITALAAPNYLDAISDPSQDWHTGQVRAAFDPGSLLDTALGQIPPPGFLVVCNGERAVDQTSRVVAEGVTVQETNVEWLIYGAAGTLSGGFREGLSSPSLGQPVSLDQMVEDAITNLHGLTVAIGPPAKAVLYLGSWARYGTTERSAMFVMTWRHFWLRKTVR